MLLEQVRFDKINHISYNELETAAGATGEYSEHFYARNGKHLSIELLIRKYKRLKSQSLGCIVDKLKIIEQIIKINKNK